MTIRSVGYDGSIGEVDWSAYLAPYLGAPDMVARQGDFKVSATTGLSVQVAPGLAHGFGVTDVSDAAEVIQLDAATSGTRFDCVVLRRDWSGQSNTPTGAATGGRTTVGFVKGGASQIVPPLQRSGGQLTEHALALVKVTAGASTVQVVDDLRATHAKAAYARSLLAMTGPLGTRYVLEPDGRRYVMTANSAGVPQPVPEWEPDPITIPPIPYVASGTRSVTTNASGAAIVPHGLGRQPSIVHAAPRLAAASPLVEVYVSSAAGAVNNANFTITAKVATATGYAPYVGTITNLDWIAVG